MIDTSTFKTLIVGGGPGGMAAAWAAASASGSQGIALVDDNFAPGGQIWRGEAAGPTHADSLLWFERFRQSRVEFLGGTRVMDQPSPGVLLAEVRTASGVQIRELRYEQLVLATGARERFLPFPGWTLPGVLGAGGLQAQVKNGLPIAGQRVVVAGTGPLLMAVAAYLVKHGARVVLIAEQASPLKLARFAAGLLPSKSKLAQAFNLKMDLRGVPYKMGCWPLAALGHGKVEGVRLENWRGAWNVACDYLACGFHLVPSLELASLLGCTVKDGAVAVGAMQETSVKGIYCVGESVGIGGLECALVEGQIAGFATAGENGRARGLVAERTAARRFAELLNKTFALREELKTLPRGDTIVCRCEDVTLERLASHATWRSAKLHTRCGMGPCQGRVCGAATEFLLGLTAESIRPPVFPTRLELLALPPAARAQDEGQP